jgi:hypothetical protein
MARQRRAPGPHIITIPMSGNAPHRTIFVRDVTEEERKQEAERNEREAAAKDAYFRQRRAAAAAAAQPRRTITIQVHPSRPAVEVIAEQAAISERHRVEGFARLRRNQAAATGSLSPPEPAVPAPAPGRFQRGGPAGPGRPSSMPDQAGTPLVQAAFRLPAAWQALRALAEERGIKPVAVLRDALDEYMDRHVP